MEDLLKLILTSDLSHAKWLNTLSFLEYVGARKLVKSQDEKTIDFNFLKHFSEEARHALFFKRILEKHFPNHCPNFDPEYLIGYPISAQYLKNIDHMVTEVLEGKSDLNYLYVTYIVECRAFNVYEHYNELLKINKYNFLIESIIKEERVHLKESLHYLYEKDHNSEQKIQAFSNREKVIFESVCQAIEEEIETGKASVSL